METATNSFTYEIPIRSAILSTVLVIVADVLVLSFVHHSLHKIGAFLALRQLFKKKKAVKISELWFEEITGRTHGPLWFRYTQAGVKTIIFAASIAMSLSINGNTQDRLENMAGQTILVQKPRTLQNLGLGHRKNEETANFSQELHFILRHIDCYEVDIKQWAYYSVRLTSPVENKWSSVLPEIDCLTNDRGFVHPPVQTLAFDLMQNAKKLHKPCNISALSPSELKKNGVFNFTVSGCPSTVLSSECFTGKFHTVCGALFTVGESQWLYMNVENSTAPSETLLPRYQYDRVPIRTGKDTLSVALRIAEHAPYLGGEGVMMLALFQAASNRTVIVRKGSQLVTEIKGRLLWPSLAVIGTILVSCCALSLAVLAGMLYTRWNGLDVGFSPEQVARLATMANRKNQKQVSWYLQLHHRSPHVTVSTDPTKVGDWEEENVENKYKKIN